MCGRYTLSSTGEIVAELFRLTDIPELSPRYNIAPTQEVPAVLVDPSGNTRQCRMLRWGLIPSWAKDSTIGSRMINARAETVAEKPSFRSAFRRRRCLLVADGFYEWKKLERGKQPYYIRLKDERPFAFAGLWEHWEGAGGEVIESCTIVTTEPNKLVAGLHNRMPVIVSPDGHAAWLDPASASPDALRLLLRPYPPDEMTAYPVSTRVNSPANDVPECVDALA